MVEINIERKKKPVWPWILLLLIVALLVWAIYELTNDRDDTDMDEAPATGMLLPAEIQHQKSICFYCITLQTIAMKNDDLRNERLVALSAMKDYKIAKDNPDVLGWRVVGSDGESLGLVRDLIADPKAMKARYLSVMADRKYFNADRDQYLLVPIGAAALDRSGKKVFLSSLDAASIGKYPVYDGGPIPEDYELAVRDTYQRSQREALADDRTNTEFDEALKRDQAGRHISSDFYNDDTYNEERFYTSNREVYRDRNYPTYTNTNPATNLHSEEARPQSVEDSIATIERLEQLRERGSITEEEFMTLKKRALNL